MARALKEATKDTLMPLHLQQIEKFLKLTPATIGSLAWDNGEPAYCTSLTSNLVLPAPTGLTEGSTMMIFLQGNTGAFVWDLSNYQFGELNDGTPFVPNQSTVTTKMDRMSVVKVGPLSTDLEAVWQRGCPHVVPT